MQACSILVSKSWLLQTLIVLGNSRNGSFLSKGDLSCGLPHYCKPQTPKPQFWGSKAPLNNSRWQFPRKHDFQSMATVPPVCTIPKTVLLDSKINQTPIRLISLVQSDVGHHLLCSKWYPSSAQHLPTGPGRPSEHMQEEPQLLAA